MTTGMTNITTNETCDLQTQPSETSMDTMFDNRRAIVPRADILENAQDIVVLADLPGVDESSIDITVEKNILTIAGTSQIEPPGGMKLAFGEFTRGDYQRRFALPNEINKDGIKASMKNGVLRLILPKSAEAQVRKITVQTQ